MRLCRPNLGRGPHRAFQTEVVPLYLCRIRYIHGMHFLLRSKSKKNQWDCATLIISSLLQSASAEICMVLTEIFLKHWPLTSGSRRQQRMLERHTVRCCNSNTPHSQTVAIKVRWVYRGVFVLFIACTGFGFGPQRLYENSLVIAVFANNQTFKAFIVSFLAT